MRVGNCALGCVAFVLMVGSALLLAPSHGATSEANETTWPTVPMDSDAQRFSSERLMQLIEEPDTAGAAPDFRVVSHDLLVDIPHGEAVVDLRFSEAPNLRSVDSSGRQSHSFQYFLSEPNWSTFYSRSGGFAEPIYPLLIVRGEEVHYQGQVIIREVEPLFDCSKDPACGGWGPNIAASSISQDGKRVIFKFPISVFDAADGSKPYVGGSGFAAHYFLELYRFGATTGGVVQGIARVGTVEARMHVKLSDTGRGLYVDVLTVLPTATDPFSFFAAAINVRTLEFGPNRARPLNARLVDVNGDGSLDLRLSFQLSDPFQLSDLGLTCIDREVRLTGEIPDFVQGNTRALFVAREPIEVMGCR